MALNDLIRDRIWQYLRSWRMQRRWTKPYSKTSSRIESPASHAKIQVESCTTVQGDCVSQLTNIILLNLFIYRTRLTIPQFRLIVPSLISSAFVREWHRLRKYRKSRRSAYGKVRISGSRRFLEAIHMPFMDSVIVIYCFPCLIIIARSYFSKKDISRYLFELLSRDQFVSRKKFK